MAVSNVLKHLNVNFKGVNVLEDEMLRQGIKDFLIGLPYRSFMLKKNLLVVVILLKKCLKKVI